MQLLGFGYVSGVTERRHPLLSKFGNFSEASLSPSPILRSSFSALVPHGLACPSFLGLVQIVKIVALAPIFFVVGPAHTIAGVCCLPTVLH